MLNEGDTQITQVVEFEVIDGRSTYNTILANKFFMFCKSSPELATKS